MPLIILPAYKLKSKLNSVTHIVFLLCLPLSPVALYTQPLTGALSNWREIQGNCVHVCLCVCVCVCVSLHKRSNETLLQLWAQRAEGLRVMQMYWEEKKMEFPFNTVPDNIQCRKCSPQAAREWNNKMESLIWYDWTVKGAGVSVNVKYGAVRRVITDLDSSIQIESSI